MIQKKPAACIKEKDLKHSFQYQEGHTKNDENKLGYGMKKLPNKEEESVCRKNKLPGTMDTISSFFSASLETLVRGVCTAAEDIEFISQVSSCLLVVAPKDPEQIPEKILHALGNVRLIEHTKTNDAREGMVRIIRESIWRLKLVWCIFTTQFLCLGLLALLQTLCGSCLGGQTEAKTKQERKKKQINAFI